MKNSLTILFLMIIISFSGCKMAEVVLPNDSIANAYDVKGKRKIQWKTKISFGDYVAKETKKSFDKKSTTTMSLGKFDLFEKNKQRHTFQYEINNIKSNISYNVVATHNVNQSNLNQIKDFVEIIKILGAGDSLSVHSESDLNPKDYLIGAIKKIDENKIYRFGISDVSRYSIKPSKGYLIFDDRKILIEEVEEVTQGWLPDDKDNLVYGFNFKEGHQYLGTVRIYQGGKVWIEKGLSLELKDLVATLSMTMLIKRTE